MNSSENKESAQVYPSKTFCIKAWTNLHISTDGKVFPCCSSTKQIGDINENPNIKEMLNNDEHKELRRKSLTGQYEEGCRSCYNKEAAGIKSLRETDNEDFFEDFKHWVDSTDEDGYSKDSIPVNLDIRFSNLCNLRCVMCGPMSSSKWFGKYKKYTNHKPEGQDKAILEIPNSENISQQIREFLPSTKSVYFAGGEPLTMKQHYDILEFVSEHNKGVKIDYNTNLTSLKYRGKSVLDYWKNLNNIFIGVSLDGCGEKGEFIREGISYDKIIENINIIKKEVPHAHIHIAPTIFSLNIKHIPDFIENLIDNGVLNSELSNINFDNVLMYMERNCIQNLPRLYKSQISQDFYSFYEKIKVKHPEGYEYIKTSLNNVLSFMYQKEYDQEKFRSFMTQGVKDAEFMGKDFFEVFPEFEDYRSVL